MKVSILFVLAVPAVVMLLGQTPSTGAGGAAGSGEWATSVASRHRHAPAVIRERHGGMVTTSNWSGYGVTGPNGSVTDVTGSWIVPTANCVPGTPNAYAAFWIGIDGYSTNTVEQIGTDSDCVNGVASYYLWYEFYPHASYTVNNFPISPGDQLSAEVKNSGKGGQFTVELTNVTNKNSKFSISTKMPQAKASSAEWIAEAPFSGGVLPLANFGTALFGSDYTGAMDTCFATVSGKTSPIGSFNSNNVFQITMVGDNGNPKAEPSSLSADHTSFTDTWFSAGP